MRLALLDARRERRPFPRNSDRISGETFRIIEGALDQQAVYLSETGADLEGPGSGRQP